MRVFAVRAGLRRLALIVALAPVTCCLAARAQLADEVAPIAPPAPAIPPTITYPIELDRDLDHVDDLLNDRLASLRARIAAEPDAGARAGLIAEMSEPVGVEMLFAQPIAQADLDAFVRLGGKVRHVFRYVSYGWGGTLPLDACERLPRVLGNSFVAVLADRPAHPDLDDATRSGRARPVWAAGFAGSPSGFTGGSATSIAVLDTGIDGTHPDLSGRMRYWMDWPNGSATPVDYDGHGTHAAGVALGSGSVAGTSPTTLRLTDSGDLTSVSAGSFNAWPMHLPAGSTTLAMTATFLGGGQATLGYAYGNDGSTSYTLGSPTSTGVSPRTVSPSFTAQTTRHYSTYLTKTSGSTVTRYATAASVTYAGVGDGFPALSGVAPGCYWVGHKVYANNGTGGDTTTIGYALDECIAYNATYGIKIVSMSLSTASTHSPTRNKVNTCAENGIIVTASAGNSGPTGVMTDPARARLAITTAASSDSNVLTDYSSTGNFTQEWNTDYKPDLCPPGGSKYNSHVMGPDANQSDAGINTFADVYANDYTNIRGTSVSAPFAAGAAALVIQALEARGLTWSYASDEHPRLVKMLLLATATETNANREGGTNNPTLGRATTPRDMYEGYGLINCDAAVEAAYQAIAPGEAFAGTTTGGAFDRRAWARKATLGAGAQINLALDVPAGADYDLYLYSGTPDANGCPTVLASSATAGSGTDEAISHTPAASGTAYIVVKRISGSGAWSLTYTSPATITVTSPNGGESWAPGSSHDITWTYTGGPGAEVAIELLKGGVLNSTIAAATSSGSGGTGSYPWTIPAGATPAADYRVRVVSTTNPAATDTSDADFTLTPAPTSTIVADRSGSPGGSVTLSATLLRQGDAAPVEGRTVAFTVAGAPVGSAATNASGVAQVSYSIGESDTTCAIGASFAGDATYGGSSGSGTLTVSPAATTLALTDADGVAGTSVSLGGSLVRNTDGAGVAGRTVHLSVDGTGVADPITGATGAYETTYAIPPAFAVGAHTTSAAFDGDAAYQAAGDSASLHVSSHTTVAVPGVTGQPGQNVSLAATLTADNTGAPLPGRVITIALDGTVIGTPTTDASGVGRVTNLVGDAATSHTIAAQFAGEADYEPGSGTGTLTVEPANTTQYTIDRTGIITRLVTLRQFDLKRTTDNALLAGKAMDFRIDGTSVGSATTDAGGDSSLDWTITNGPATRTITTVFTGDSAYNGSSAAATLNAQTMATKIFGVDRAGRITSYQVLRA
jgi:subtilisin family serine protease/predicted secreted protein